MIRTATGGRSGAWSTGLRALALAALAACGEAPADEEPPRERRIVETTWEVAWMRGGSEWDSSLLLPVALAADGERVYVADRFGHRVVAFDVRDGRLAWSFGREGSGPQELREPATITALPEGGVAVADPRNRRISLVTAAGELMGAVPFPESFNVGSLCALRDGSLVLANVNPGHPVVRLSREGRVLHRAHLPWSDLEEGSWVRRQALLAPTTGGEGCVAALSLGRGFATYTPPSGFGAARPYVERLELPEVRVVQTGMRRSERLAEVWEATRSVSVAGDTITVAFIGKTPRSGRIVDLYSVRTGRYLHSYESPPVIDRLLVSGSRHFVLTMQNGYPALLAHSVTPKG